jgi:hypothetical protein
MNHKCLDILHLMSLKNGAGDLILNFNRIRYTIKMSSCVLGYSDRGNWTNSATCTGHH